MSSPRCGDVSSSLVVHALICASSPRCGDVSSLAYQNSLNSASSPRCGDVSSQESKTGYAHESSPRCGDVSYRLKMPLTGTLLSPQSWGVFLYESRNSKVP